MTSDLLAVYHATDPVAWRARVADRRALAVLDEYQARGRGSIPAIAEELGVSDGQVNEYLKRARALRKPGQAARLAAALSLDDVNGPADRDPAAPDPRQVR